MNIKKFKKHNIEVYAHDELFIGDPKSNFSAFIYTHVKYTKIWSCSRGTRKAVFWL